MSHSNPADRIAKAMRAEWDRGQRDKTQLINVGIFSVGQELSWQQLAEYCKAAYDDLTRPRDKRKRGGSRHARCEHGKQRRICQRCLWAGTGGQSLCPTHGRQRRYAHGRSCSECIAELKSGDLDS